MRTSFVCDALLAASGPRLDLLARTAQSHEPAWIPVSLQGDEAQGEAFLALGWEKNERLVVSPYAQRPQQVEVFLYKR